MRAWRKRHAGLDEERVAAELGEWLSEPRTNGEIRERVAGYEGVLRRAVGPDRLRPHAAAAGAAPAGRVLGRPRACELPDRSATAPGSRRRRDHGGGALPRGVRPGRPARHRGLGRRGPAGLHRGPGAPAARDLPRRARRRAPGPSGPAAPARVHAPPRAPARPLGPAPAGLRRPGTHHPARGEAAEPDAQRRPDRDRRRPRGRQLAARARREQGAGGGDPARRGAPRGTRARSGPRPSGRPVSASRKPAASRSWASSRALPSKRK